MATLDQVRVLVETQTGPLLARIDELTDKLGKLTANDSVGEFEEEKINLTVRCDEPLDVIKSMPCFDGKNSYVSWREAATHSMRIYARGSKRYYSALTILRNKVTGEANDSLTNHGTVLNFDAIISRLDFAYADKRPLHLIEQELSIMRQGSQTIMDYYNEVNKKLTDMINKTIMTYGTNSDMTRELNNKNRQYALRVFMTGLNPPLANILFSISPNNLPDALAKAQELEANKIRADFALHFNKPQVNHVKGHNNLRFPKRFQRDSRFNQSNNQPKAEPMEIGSSANVAIRPFYQGNNQNRNLYTNNQGHFRQKTYNDYGQGMKRPFASSTQVSQQPQLKAQRINNIQEEAFLEEGMGSPMCSEHLSRAEEDSEY